MERYTRNDDFRRSIRYEEQPNRSKRTIAGKRTVHNKKFKGKIMALLLAGIITIGGCFAITNSKNAQPKEEYISTVEEIQEYDIAPETFGISSETYEEAIQIKNEIDGLELSNLSNEELAEYFDKMSDVQLKLVKEKIGNLIGKSTHDFRLQAPEYDSIGEHGRTIIREWEYGVNESSGVIGHISSDEMNDYMIDIGVAQGYRDLLKDGEIEDRARAEKRLIEINENTGSIMTIKLLREQTENRHQNLINSYRLLDQDFEKNSEEKVREGVAIRQSLSEEGRE